MQRKSARKHPLSQCRLRRHRRIAKTRARVEHVFGIVAQIGGKLICAKGQVRANFAITMMASCYNLGRLAYLKATRMVAF